MANSTVAYQQEHIHDNRQTSYIAGNAAVLAVAYTAVALRIFARWASHTRFGIDDILIVVALGLISIYVASLIILTHYGMGRHSILITDLRSFTIWSITAETLYNVDIFVIKLSITFLYQRIFSSQIWFRKSLFVLTAFITAYSLAQVFGDIFQCVPISYPWDSTVDGHCIKYSALIISMGVVNTVTDVIMLILPIPLCMKLQMSNSKKAVVIAMFSMGGIVCIFSIVRLLYANDVNYIDVSWNYVIPSTMSGTECCVAILAACFPTYRPLYNLARTGNTMNSSNATKSHQLGFMDSTMRSKSAMMRSQDSALDDEERLYHHLETETDISCGPAPRDINADNMNIMVTKSFTSKQATNVGHMVI